MSNAAALRNLAFVGHPSAGKTTLIDAMAYHLGATDRKGSVADKTSILDTEPEEHERQHTLSLAAVHAEKEGVTWTLIDTPGYPEFVADALSATIAADLVVGVISCGSGVSFNLAQKMATAAELGRGRALVVTHVDGENADFEELIGEVRARLGNVCIPVMLPDASGHGFSAVRADIGADWKKRFSDRVMDACEDEELLTTYLETGELSDGDLHEWVPTAIATGKLVPVLCCNPASGVGVPEVVAWLREYATTPDQNRGLSIEGARAEPDASAPLCGVVFNVKSDPHVGKVSLARIVRGTLKASDHVGEGKGEKLGGLFVPLGGRDRKPVESVSAGGICAFTKVEHVAWGQSFTVAGGAPKVDVPALPRPMVSLAIHPKSRNDEQKIGTALAKIHAEDPCFLVEQVELTHELVIHGMSDLHLKVALDRMKRRYGVEVTTTDPRIAYRETVTKPSEGHHRHKKQTGGRGQFGECYIRMRPGAEGSGFVFKDGVVGGAIPRNFIPAIEKGMREICETGVMTHSRVVDVEVEVYDGKFHAVDSDEASFKKAGAWAFRDAFGKGGPVLLEPVMAVEIKVPSKDAGAIFSDLTSHRRGHVLDQESEADGAITVIRAHVPLSTVQHYHRDLKSMTAGEGSYTITPDHYAPVPAVEQQRILAELGKKHEEE